MRQIPSQSRFHSDSSPKGGAKYKKEIAMNICVYGASSDRLDSIYFEEAEKLGRLIAENGCTLVFGGGRTGLMGACAQGVRKAGGRIIGISPKFFDEPGILDESCDEFYFTGTMRERKQLMEEKSDAFIALPGGIGSYEEFFEILTLKQLGRHAKPIALLSTADYYAPFYAMLEHTARLGFMSDSCLGIFRLCRSPEEALEHVLTEKCEARNVQYGLFNYNK